MADVKFSELSTLAASDVASADVIAIVDSSESASKKLSIDNLFGAVPVNIASIDTTNSTSNTTGAITTTGGIGVSKAAVVGGNLTVFGNVYVRDTGLSLTSPTDGTLDLAADTILEITAPTMNVVSTTVDFDANVVIHSTLTVNSTTALIGTTLPLHFRDTGLSLSSPTNGTLDLAADTIFEITAPTMNVIATTAVDFDTPAITANGTINFQTGTQTSGTATITGLTVDIFNKLDTGSSNDRIGAAISTYGDTSTYEIRDSVGIRAMSRQSTSAEVARLNTPIHAILDLANTAVANNSGTTLSGAYGLAIDHDDTIATRTGQPTAFISFGEMYVGGTESIETAYLFDIFPNGKTGDATYGTAANVAFYINGAQYATTKDSMILNSTDGAPGTDEYCYVLMEPDVGKDTLRLGEVVLTGGWIAFETGHHVLDEDGSEFIQSEDYTSEVDAGFLIKEDDEDPIVLEESSQDNRTGDSDFILFETGSQDADGVLKIRVNGEDKYLQLYSAPGEGGSSY
jgi:hypothetical protein